MPAERRLPHTAWLAVPPGCAAEHGVEISDLGQAATASQNPPGSAPSSPAATDVSDAAAAAAAADPPMSAEADLQKVWRLFDRSNAFFLCTSLVQFVIRRSIFAGVWACCAIAAAVVHLRRRRCQQHRARGDNAVKAIEVLVTFSLVAVMVGLLDVNYSMAK